MVAEQHKRPSQKMQILEHLRLYGHITPLEALTKYGCFRLGARIWELKNVDHIPIPDPRMVNVEGKVVADYYLEKCNDVGQFSLL